jgi:hypothetical protein
MAMMKRLLISSDQREIGLYVDYPQRDAKHDEFNCSYGTFGFANDINLSAIGIDAFQSVMNALMRLDYFIKNSEEFSALDLKWIGASCPGDL